MDKKKKAERIREILGIYPVYGKYEECRLTISRLIDSLLINDAEIDFIVHLLRSEKYKMEELIEMKIRELEKLKS